MKEYKTSIDYIRLLALLREGKSVICFIKYREKSKTKDIAVFHQPGQYRSTYELSCRGVCYLSFDPCLDSDEDFVEYCRNNGVEFIAPEASAQLRSTGLKDCNGELIVEGDTIVLSRKHYPDDELAERTIVFENGMFCAELNEKKNTSASIR